MICCNSYEYIYIYIYIYSIYVHTCIHTYIDISKYIFLCMCMYICNIYICVSLFCVHDAWLKVHGKSSKEEVANGT